MKKFFFLLSGLFCLGGLMQVHAQCTNGNLTTLDWDYLDFFPSAGSGTYTNLSQSQTQHFTFGAQRVTITHNYTGSGALGENATNTAVTGEDLQFQGNGAITFTFQNAVQNVKFALYDIDAGQRVQIDAKNGITPVNVNLTKVSGNILTISNNNTPTASVDATANSAAANTSNDGTVNVELAGSVTSFTININNSGAGGCNGGGNGCSEFGAFWLSDITACSAGSFPANYYEVSKPFTGQPGYVLVVRDNSFYYVNPATGQAKFLFSDPGHTNMNSVAYDPVNKFIYYVHSLTGPIGTNGAATTNSNNKTLRRYDYNMDTFGIVLKNVNNIGVPTFDGGVESGAAAFYNGSLYLGIETPASANSSNESIVWKIDFDKLHQPISAAQVYGIASAGHDWADIGISKGILYDFDGSSSNPDFFHLNMLTGVVTKVQAATGLIPRQTAVDWQEVVYNIGTASSGTSGVIAPYNLNGNVVTAQEKAITENGLTISGSWGDAAEAFRPKADFGDAPSSYDPDIWAPALHEYSPNLRLGAKLDIEWQKQGVSAAADSDGNDEDGLPFVRIISSAAGIYYTDVKVYNNTGANAIVAGWVDFNKSGTFEPEEGVTALVPSSPLEQTIQLTWKNIPQNLPSNTFTYLRLRVSSESSKLATTNPTGYMPIGEVEDFQVEVNVTPLAVRLLDFNVQKEGGQQAKISWKVETEPGAIFILEKSADEKEWTPVKQFTSKEDGVKIYSLIDINAVNGKITYRLRYIDAAGKTSYSPARSVWYDQIFSQLNIFPNPAKAQATLHYNALASGNAILRLFDNTGRNIINNSVELQKGLNIIDLPFIGRLPAGFYQVQINYNGSVHATKLMVGQ